MYNQLSQKQLGLRLAFLRKQKGLSQENLSKLLELSRSSIAQIELGNRGIDIFELQRFSAVLGFSLDDLMSLNFNAQEKNVIYEPEVLYKNEERVAVPNFNLEKCRNILLYLFERCAGKPSINENLIFSLLYFIDFNFYELYEVHLSGCTYKKLSSGPVPLEFASVINDMLENQEIMRLKVPFLGQIQIRYLPLVKANLSQIKANEKEVIDSVIQLMGDWSELAMKQYSMNDLPMLTSTDGDEINFELTFYRERPYSVRNYDYSDDES
jgi:transcriptional regulator with XRE-family HTH domain